MGGEFSVGYDPPVALAAAILIGNATESFDNEYGGLNCSGGLLIAEICMATGMWNRRRRRLADEAWERAVAGKLRAGPRRGAATRPGWSAA